MRHFDDEKIFNNVVVNECEFFNGTFICLHDFNDIGIRDACENRPDCYYKQFKRAKQENEELRQKIQSIRKSNRCKHYVLGECAIPKGGNHNGNCIGFDKCIDKYTEYKQILKKIKEIAEKTLNMVDYKTYFKRDNKSLKQESFKTLKQIQEKINEVIDVPSDSK